MAVCLLPVIWLEASADPASLRLCSEDWPPYEYHVDGKARGLSHDIVVAVLERMGVGVAEATSVAWIRGLEAIRSGEMDLLYSALKTPEREEYAFFPSEALANSKWVLFALKSREDNLAYSDVSELKGKTVGVVRGYVYPKEFIDQVRAIGTVEERTLSVDNIRKLSTGRIDYAIEDELVGLHLIDRIGMRGAVIPLRERVIVERPVFAMFSKATVSENFVRRFSQELTTFKRTPEYKKIVAKYH